jgi:hypothetical protein
MRINTHCVGAALLAVLFLAGVPVYAAQPVKSDDSAPKGVLELECNISEVDLYLCPRDKFVRKTNEKFFGLIKSHEETCSDGQFFLGTTPLKPRQVPAGQYVLLIPPGYAWEHKGLAEINIQPDEKSVFLLKLFNRQNKSFEAGPGDPSGGSVGGGSGSGGAPGNPPPPP